MRHDSWKPAERRRWFWVSAVLLALGLSSGCSHTERGLAAGGVGGAVVGGLVGKALGNPAAGAVIGGATGAIAGGAIGSKVDRAEARAEVRAIQAARGPLGLEQVVQMTQSNVSDDVIIQQMQLTGAVYTLNVDQITWLHQQGVSDRVIQAMQTSGTRPVAYQAPPPAVIYQPRPVYMLPPPCYHRPRPAVGFGIHIHD